MATFYLIKQSRKMAFKDISCGLASNPLDYSTIVRIMREIKSERFQMQSLYVLDPFLTQRSTVRNVLKMGSNTKKVWNKGR